MSNQTFDMTQKVLLIMTDVTKLSKGIVSLLNEFIFRGRSPRDFIIDNKMMIFMLIIIMILAYVNRTLSETNDSLRKDLVLVTTQFHTYINQHYKTEETVVATPPSSLPDPPKPKVPKNTTHVILNNNQRDTVRDELQILLERGG